MENFNSDPKPGRLILPLVLIGMKSKNIDTKNNIRNQNSPCPFQEIIFESTYPVDSRSK